MADDDEAAEASAAEDFAEEWFDASLPSVQMIAESMFDTAGMMVDSEHRLPPFTPEMKAVWESGVMGGMVGAVVTMKNQGWLLFPPEQAAEIRALVESRKKEEDD